MDQNGSLLIYFFFFGRGTQFNPEFSFVTLHPFYKVFSISCAVSGTHLRGFVELRSLIHWFLQPPMFASLESLVLLPSVGFNEASAVLCLVALSCLTLRNPMDCSPPSSSVHGDSSGKNTGVGCHSLLQGISPGIKPRSSTLQADSLQSEPPGKHKNIGVDSLSLLQGIFPAQESNWNLLHCRWIPCQLSYPGS